MFGRYNIFYRCTFLQSCCHTVHSHTLQHFKSCAKALPRMHKFFSSIVHCNKKVTDFPVPSRDVTNQTIPGRESLVSDIPAGTSKSLNFFTVYTLFFI